MEEEKLMEKEKLRELVLDYYWMTCYPNADYQEFEKTWLKSNDNEAFINGLIERFVKFIEQNSIDKDTHGRILKTSLDKIVELTKERDELKNQLIKARKEGLKRAVEIIKECTCDSDESGKCCYCSIGTHQETYINLLQQELEEK